MELTLSSNKPTNTVLYNSEGQAMYISHTPSHLTTVISRVQPHYRILDRIGSGAEKDAYKDDGGDEEAAPSYDETIHEPGVTELAQIHWKPIGPSTIQYKGMQALSSDLFNNEDLMDL
jgi:hypothetical protein